MRWFYKANIDFVGKRKLFFGLSTIAVVGGLILSLILGVQYGIDFQGGTEIAVKFEKDVATQEIRTAITNAGFDGSEIKTYGVENSYLIRVKDSEEAPEEVRNALSAKFPEAGFEILKIDKIGPKIGSELRTDAFIAIILAVFAILIYIGFRFEFVFGLGAIAALVHDVILTFSVVVLVGHSGLINLEIDLTILAAMLTVVGYSINDTVIIFDRIRENRDVYKGRDFIWMINQSINETLSRTINTLITTMLVLLTIVFFGGPVLQGFAFTMLIGFITGTYSSIFIASPFVIWYLGKVKKVDLAKGLPKKEGLLSS